MSKRNGQSPAEVKKAVRCAVYTRKSTEEGLEQAFNSLDAQRQSAEAYVAARRQSAEAYVAARRQSAEAYVAARRHEGWACLPDRYDDGGYTGGDLDRPAMRRLLADIEAGKVDCVVVYKVDRLSRSLMDFARAMRAFERHGTG